MVFLGIDIGFDRCGYAIIEIEDFKSQQKIISAGCIYTNREESIIKRLCCLRNDVDFILKKYNPQFISIEKLFFHRKNPTFEKICMSKGAVLSLLDSDKFELLEIEPKTIKKYITGNGNSAKKDIKIYLEKILKMDLSGFVDDTLDALSLALYHIDLIRFNSQVEKEI